LHRLVQIIAFVSLIACWAVVAPAQSVRTDSTEAVLKQLLAAPAPTPRTAGTVGENTTPEQHPPGFYDRKKMPPDDAPLGDLVAYWSMWANNGRRPEVSSTVVTRLLEGADDYPEMLPRLLGAFPRNEATTTRVKELYDRALVDQQMERETLEKIRFWLVYNSNYFTTELLTAASKVRDNERGYIDQPEALVALARIDWSAAEPLVQSLVNGNQPRSATLALTLLYNHAIADKDLTEEQKLRDRLQIVAADRNAAGHSRNMAITTLAMSEWSGRDDWYLSLFHDDSLLNSADGIYPYSLGSLMLKEPDKWIPVMAKMMESNDRTVRNATASCLLLFQNNPERPEALRALLPWLSNPDWIKDSFNQRVRFIQGLQYINLPESVPGLIWVVEHDNSEAGGERQFAAQTLARYKDPRAIPALKKALVLAKHEISRRLILEGLVACGGLLEAEQLEAIEEYAAKLAEPGGRESLLRGRSYNEEPLPLPLSIGMFLSLPEREAPEGLLRAVLARAAVLKKSNPAVAKALLDIVHGWKGPQVDLDMVQRLASGTADADLIRNALGRREKLRESVNSELQALSGAVDMAQGAAPVLLEDASLAQSLLSSGSETSQIALLACARLVQFPLPVDVVGRMLPSKNQLLALAAESYLLAEDSKEARELLWAHHPKEAFITGWRDNLTDISSGNFTELSKLEDKLRGEFFKEDPPLETIALISNSVNNNRVLRVYADRAVYTHYENAARYRDRIITKEELASFRDFITTNNFADLGPALSYCHYDCSVSELLLVTKEKGRRVLAHERFFNEQQSLLENIDRLGRGDNAKIHYNLEKEIKGLEVLYADGELVVKDVWQGEAGIRIFVQQMPTQEEANAATEPDNSGFEEDDTMREERQRQEIAREKARFTWRAFANGKAGAISAAPAEFSQYDESKFPAVEDWSERDVRDVQFVPPDSLIIANRYEGLWRQVAGRKPVKISDEGTYSFPIVTPDGKWLVVAKTGESSTSVVRFNLQTGREFPVNLPEADEFSPLAYVAPHGRVLVRRARAEDESSTKAVGPEKPEYYLVDAATGKTDLVTGVFEPLHQAGPRSLQPTGKPNEFWVAIPNPGTNQTRVGRYNVKDFSFQEALLVPHITFDSMSLWVDGVAGKLLIVFEGQLLSLPLPRTPEDAPAPKKARSQPN
jgi:hypothetical protein